MNSITLINHSMEQTTDSKKESFFGASPYLAYSEEIRALISDIRQEQLDTVLMALEECDCPKTVEKILKTEDDATKRAALAGYLFFSAARRGRVKVITMLLEAGADINALDSRGSTVLHFAAQGHHRELVEFLLQKGAKANVVDSLLNTPLDYTASTDAIDIREDAVPYHDNEVSQILRARGALTSLELSLRNVNFQNSTETPAVRVSPSGPFEYLGHAILN